MNGGKDNKGREFISLLERGIIRKILPNTSDDYSDWQEDRDLFLYKKFLQSFAFDDILECEVKKYNGDEV